MSMNNINISNIEDFLYGIVMGTVSDNVYIGTLPDTLDATWEDACLIDVGNPIDDYDAFGNGVVLIWLYARPIGGGVKNSAKMAQMEEQLNEAIKNATSGHYAISRRQTYTDYDAERKWHCNIITLNIVIV